MSAIDLARQLFVLRIEIYRVSLARLLYYGIDYTDTCDKKQVIKNTNHPYLKKCCNKTSSRN